MLVFIRLLPDAVTRGDLRQFVIQGCQPSILRPLRRPARINRFEIVKITNLRTKTVEYHGLAEIEPAKAALSVIKRLNRAELKGRKIEVRKFYRRSQLRDRRGQQPPVEHLSIHDRRKLNRRRILQVATVGRAGPLSAANHRSIGLVVEAQPEVV